MADGRDMVHRRFPPFGVALAPSSSLWLRWRRPPASVAIGLSMAVETVSFEVIHAKLFRLYWAFFGRSPDPGGALYWVEQHDDCLGLDGSGVSRDLVSRVTDTIVKEMTGTPQGS